MITGTAAAGSGAAVAAGCGLEAGGVAVAAGLVVGVATGALTREAVVPLGDGCGVVASCGHKPASLARSPPLATVTSPFLAHGTSSFQNWKVARWALITYELPMSAQNSQGTRGK